MISITAKALEYIRSRAQPLYLEMPPRVTTCCMTIQEAPVPRLGEPERPEGYVHTEVQGVDLAVPRGFSVETPYVIDLRAFLGIKRLVLEGWRQF